MNEQANINATGKESRSEWAQAWTVKAGVITHMQEYVDTAAVSRAHTLAPSDSLKANWPRAAL
jgi:ketosteroid isomerase-like protein